MKIIITIFLTLLTTGIKAQKLESLQYAFQYPIEKVLLEGKKTFPSTSISHIVLSLNKNSIDTIEIISTDTSILSMSNNFLMAFREMKYLKKVKAKKILILLSVLSSEDHFKLNINSHTYEFTAFANSQLNLGNKGRILVRRVNIYVSEKVR